MSATEIDLLSQIAADPEDDDALLVYADLLSERGDPRGEFIHLGVSDATDPAYPSRDVRARELLADHWEQWAAPWIEAMGGTIQDLVHFIELDQRVHPNRDPGPDANHVSNLVNLFERGFYRYPLAMETTPPAELFALSPRIFVLGEWLTDGPITAVRRGVEYHASGPVGEIAFKAVAPLWRDHLDTDPNFTTRLARVLLHEANVLEVLGSKPNVVSMRGPAQWLGHYGLSLEWLEGEDIGRLIEQSGALPIPVAAAIAAEVASALAAIHATTVFDRPLVFRELRPDHVFVTSSGRVVVIDFGWVDMPGGLFGPDSPISPGWGLSDVRLANVSPEQISGRHVVDARADLFSLGTLLYYMSTGVHPFAPPEGGSMYQALSALRSATCVAPSATNPAYPPRLQQILAHLMNPEPEERYQCASDVRADLQAFIGRDPASVVVEWRAGGG